MYASTFRALGALVALTLVMDDGREVLDPVSVIEPRKPEPPPALCLVSDPWSGPVTRMAVLLERAPGGLVLHLQGGYFEALATPLSVRIGDRAATELFHTQDALRAVVPAGTRTGDHVWVGHGTLGDTGLMFVPCRRE